ncbi:olfactory receptor 10A4-like [Carettochelys insculpta]|uniref:olfactory receptor 10A4-like n=1 Tax=Carettochelys insculpta TaxID=44489 RepID=UPI003EBAA4DE
MGHQYSGASWVISISVEVAQTTWIFSLPFCGSNRIQHFFCDIPAVLKMACADTSKTKIMISTTAGLFIINNLFMIILSYICIISNILKLLSAEGRLKAFSTCSAFLMVMSSSQREYRENQTISDVFILVGFSHLNELQILLFVVLLVIYLLALMGNLLIILLIQLNSSLHTPMYFFLVHLSVVEICYTTSVFPQLLVHLLVKEKTISIVGCAAQMVVITITSLTEGCLLTAMSYDRYMAICHPLHYTTTMSGRVCAVLAGASWLISILVEIAQTTWLFSLPFCGSNNLHHFFCDLPPIMEVACVNTSNYEILLLTVSVLFILGPFLLIILSYILIISTIFKVPSPEGRRKALSTCSSHIMLVTIFYGTPLFTYLMPKSSSIPESDQLISLINSILIPLSNPVIYTLRNKEVKAALRKTLARSIF